MREEDFEDDFDLEDAEYSEELTKNIEEALGAIPDEVIEASDERFARALQDAFMKALTGEPEISVDILDIENASDILVDTIYLPEKHYPVVSDFGIEIRLDGCLLKCGYSRIVDSKLVDFAVFFAKVENLDKMEKLQVARTVEQLELKVYQKLERQRNDA